MNRLDRPEALAGTAIVLAIALGVLLPPHTFSAQWLHLFLLVAFSAISSVRAVRERCLAWGLVATFAWCTSIAQVLWVRAGVVGGPQGSGGSADAIYLAGVAAGVVGVGAIVFSPLKGPRRWRSISDGAVVGGAVVLALWTFLYEPQLDLLSPPAARDQTGRIALVAIDVVVASVLVLAARYQPRRPVVGWFGIAVAMAAAADTAVVFSLGRGDPAASIAANVPWNVAAVAFVVASLIPDRPFDPDPDPVPRRWLVSASLLLAVAAVAGQWVINRSMEETTVAMIAVYGLLVVTNQALVNREVRQLTLDNEAARVRVEESERRFRSIFEQAPVSISIASADGRVLDANPATAELFGIPAEELVGRSLREMLTPDGWEERERLVAQLLSGEAERVKRSLVLPSARNGQTLRLELTVSAYQTPEGEFRLIGVAEDVTEREAARKRLEHLADHDPLTGLSNRYRFTRELTERLDAGDSVAVAFVDLDRFKVINDGMGHEIGDRVLLETASRLERAVRGDGVVARFGGDEFTMLLEADRPGRVDITVERVLAAMAPPIEHGDGTRFHQSVSIGVSRSRPGCHPEQLISEADAAMYRAKERGGNRAEHFSATGPRDAGLTLELIEDLHLALERDELVLHYQPVIDVRTGRTRGYEALLRWQHPRFGLLAPDRFLDVAEETGLIVDIGDWALRTACARAAAWPLLCDGDELSISVNLSARQLGEAGLIESVRDALTTSGLEADRLWLEMTETAVMADARSAAEALKELRALGVHLALDDFGTGYSSLTYLKRFPFESIKIDRSFVEGLGSDPDDSAIVAAVVGLARGLGLTSIAEGVEMPLQMRALAELGCDLVQGYMFGRPAAIPTIESGWTSNITDALT